ncbi:hypothetical protein KR093_007952 [Drosophila rubida]|uniref:Elongation of very long chain fatty acids protein n=1 Tax=Drosophila rubida TaxID=30044 RepID=A0AAD4JUP0_9MUSC|nr:hypothetical protein KR093_007952 [Drosophila rubida]
MYELFPVADPLPWPYTGILWPIATTLAAYLVFVLKLGPMWMAIREPFKLRGVLKVYNISQIAFNTMLLIGMIHMVFWHKIYDFSCMRILPFDHEMKDSERIISYLYYINKIFDLLDTVFFVLRKSFKQVTNLHLIHHVYMAGAAYFFQRLYGYGGHFAWMEILNTLTHVVMYTYYYLASQNPNVKQSIWWKQYVTIIQMVQFILMFGHSLWTFLQPDCDVPLPMMMVVMVMSGLMFVMFGNFYRTTYLKKKNT